MTGYDIRGACTVFSSPIVKVMLCAVSELNLEIYLERGVH